MRRRRSGTGALVDCASAALCARLWLKQCVLGFRAKLKNEKQQLCDLVEALSKRVERLEESRGTGRKHNLAAGEACSGPGSRLVTSPSTATTPEHLPFTDMAGAGPSQHLSSANNPTDKPGDAWRDAHRLFELNRCGQSKFSYFATCLQ